MLALFTESQSQLLVPNGNFETWGLYNTWTLDPEFWITGNFQLATNTLPDSSAYEGELAMYLEPFHWVAGVPGLAMTTFDASYIPESFEFAVKCNIDGEDSVKVNVQFWNNNIKQYERKWSSIISIEEWEFVQLELDNIEPAITHCTIEVWASYGQGLELEGSFLTTITIDAMSFDGVVGISGESLQNNWTTYPVPTKGYLNIDLTPGFEADRFVLRTMNGQQVIESPLAERLDLSGIAPGVYVLEVWNDQRLVGMKKVVVE
jgi:hypothetical protein